MGGTRGRLASVCARLGQPDPLAVSPSDFDDRRLVVFEPLPLAAGDWFDAAVRAPGYDPQSFNIAQVERTIETRRQDDEIDVAPLARFATSDRPEHDAGRGVDAFSLEIAKIPPNQLRNAFMNHSNTSPASESRDCASAGLNVTASVSG